MDKSSPDDSTFYVRPASAREYPVTIGNGWPTDLATRLREKFSGEPFLITHEGLEDMVLAPFLKIFAVPENRILFLPQGEHNKHIRHLQDFYNRMIREGVDRKSYVIALGGGIIGDFAGFVASTIMRGIGYVQMPTTLLAAVDSSVGGKTAVNVDLGKNMVGSFHHPAFVHFNLESLKTLPAREWNCGIAEIAKHSFMDGESLEIIRSDPRGLREPNSDVLKRAVLSSIRFKSGVVSRDEKEEGLRSILNLGHTTAHAIESATGYKVFNHGEAVARGLVTMIYLSMKLRNLSEADAEKMFETLSLLDLPADTAGLSSEELIRHMKYDKKNQAGQVRFVLLDEISNPVFGQPVDEASFRDAWEKQRERFG